MILLILLIALALFLVHQFWWRRLNYPKGPMPLPLVGNLHQMWNYGRWEDKLLEWRQEYGNVFTIWLGPVPLVSVCDYKLSVDLFVREGSQFEERKNLESFMKATRGGIYGVIDTSGSMWREQRRFCLRTFRDFGLGKNKMQERILEEMVTICENVNRDIDDGMKEHDFHKHTDMATGSVINAVLCGYRFSTDGREKEFYKMKDITDRMMKTFSEPLFNLGANSEFLSKLPIIKPKFDRAVGLFREIFHFLDKIIDDHERNSDYSMEMEPTDFIDAYLSERHRSEEKGEEHYFSRIQLSNVLFDLWFAGQETTSSTLTWSIAYLIHHPEVQQKLHEELDRVIGSDRMITVADKSQLPYTQAVIMECQRMANFVVINLPRKVAKDMVIEGQKVEKGTVVVPQISVMMADPVVFENPKKFSPSRYIDEDGSFKPKDEVLPFSIGRRQCLGEGLAKMELYLFISNIFNQYKIRATNKPPTLKKVISGVSFATEPYKCLVERRFH